MRALNKYIRLSYNDKLLFAEALVLILFSKLWLTFLPFKRAVKILKIFNIQESGVLPVANERDLINAIKYSVGRANHLAFWTNICLVRSFAAKIMLDRRGIPSVIYFGVQFGKESKLAAHAWLKCGDIFVTPRGSLRFTRIFSL